jgi:hypothetical protein
MAAKKPSGKAAPRSSRKDRQMNPYWGGQLGGEDSDDDDSDDESTLSDVKKNNFKRYVAWAMASASVAGLGYGAFVAYKAEFVQNFFKYLLDKTDAGKTLGKTMDVFNGIIAKCSSVTGTYQQHMTKSIVGKAVEHVEGVVKIPSVVKGTLDTSFMTCNEAHNALHELFAAMDATLFKIKASVIGTATTGVGTIFGIKWVSGSNPIKTIHDTIIKFVDYHEAILDKLLEGVDFTTTNVIDICKAMLAKWKAMSAAKQAELCQTAAAAVRSTPGSKMGSSASDPSGRRGGKKTNKRRKQSKRKPKRKPKRTAKRRSKK